MRIRDVLKLEGSYRVMGVEGGWMVPFHGPASLTADGMARWTANGVLDKKAVLSGRDVIVTGIVDDADCDRVCALFNTLDGGVNEFTYSKYIGDSEGKKEKKAMADMNIRIARRLVRLAKAILAADGDAPDAGLDSELARKKADIEAKLAAMHQQYEDALGERNAEYERAKEEYRTACAKMKVAVDDFDRRTGWSRQLDACAAEIEAFKNAGGSVESLQSEFDISSGISKNPSYKEWLMWVIQKLHHEDEDEFKEFEEVYLNHLDTFRKNTTKIKTSCDMLGAEKKSWSDKMTDLYGEQGMKMPKADEERTAGVLDWLGGLFRRIRSVVVDFIGVSRQNAKELDAFAASINRLVAQSQRMGGI